MIYDEEYYERGLETGKSCYQNYRWIPELTIPMAMTIIDYLGIKRDELILEIGCAKGYLVKALRLLYRQAFGVDVSSYAISNADSAVKRFCYLGSVNGMIELPFTTFNFCIAKDVFEHIDKETLKNILDCVPSTSLFVVVPLGNGNGQYVAPTNGLDKTHIICERADWWIKFFKRASWEVERFTYKISGIKDNYYEKYPKSHGFFTLRKL